MRFKNQFLIIYSLLFVLMGTFIIYAAGPELIGISNLTSGELKSGEFEINGIVLNNGQVDRVTVKAGIGPWVDADGIDRWNYKVNTQQIVVGYVNNPDPVSGQSVETPKYGPYYGDLPIVIGAFDANGNKIAEKAVNITIVPEKPYFDIISGTYSEPLNVILKAAPEITIYYTIDGSDPKTNGISYTGAIYVSQDTVVKAVSKSADNICSETAILNLKINPSNQPGFMIQYYEDQAFSRPLPDPAYLKAGTYYLKIISDRKFSGGPFINIDAPGYSNDIVNANLIPVSDCVYRYTRIVNNDAAATGDTQETVKISGVDSQGNPVTDVIPANLSVKAAYLDTQLPAEGSIMPAGEASSTNDPTPIFEIQSTDATQMRLALSETGLATASWLEKVARYDEFDISKGGNRNKTIWIEFKDRAGNIQTRHASTRVAYDNSLFSFDIEYFSDPGLTRSLGSNPYLKSGTYYLKVTANQDLNSSPTVQIDAEGSKNDLQSGSTTLINPRLFYYIRTIVSDNDAIGTVKEQIKVQGIAPSNIDLKAAYTDTAAPESPVVTGSVTTEFLKPRWTWNNVIGATRYRYSFFNGTDWMETTVTSFTPEDNLTEGNQYTLYVQAGDRAGNWSNSGSFSISAEIPKISIQRETTDIPNGTGNYNFGEVSVFSDRASDFYIKSIGTGNLLLTGTPKVQISGVDAASFRVVIEPEDKIYPGSSTYFRLYFEPTSIGTKSAIVSIANNTPDQNPYTFTVTGTGAVEDLPLDTWNERSFAEYEGRTYAFNVVAGQTYAITWDEYGDGSGKYSGDIKVAAYREDLSTTYFDKGYQGYATPWIITARDNTLYLRAEAEGAYSDGSFALKVYPIAINSLPVGTWTTGNIATSNQVIMYSFNTTPGNVYAVTWDEVSPGSGTYNGDIRVTAYREDLLNPYFKGIDSAYPIPETFIAKDNMACLAVIASRSSVTGDFAIKVFPISNKPEINIKLYGDEIPNGTGMVKFYEIPLCTTRTHALTIENNGIYDLNLTGTPKVEISGADAASFRVTKEPVSSISFYKNTPFEITFVPTGNGPKTATVSISNNSGDKNPFTFMVTGYGNSVVNQLTLGQWYEENISSGQAAKIYSFNTTPGIPYAITWKDGDEGPGSYTCDVKVSAYKQDLYSTYFTDVSGGYSFPRVIIPQENIVYLKVVGYNSTSSGSFALKVALNKPKITVKGTTTIPNGSGSYDFGNILQGSSSNATFTLLNSGVMDLNLTGTPKVQISGADVACFSVTAGPASRVLRDASTTFTVKFSPTSAGIKTAMVSIASDDVDATPYTFIITGSGAPLVPEINVKKDTTNIPNGTGIYNYGDVSTDSNRSAAFTIENTGGQNLTLADSVRISGADTGCFSVSYQPAVTIAPNRYSTCTILFTPNGIGTKTARVTIASNDPDSNPYTFTIIGTGTGPGIGEVLTLDTWTPGNIQTGGEVKTYYFIAIPGKTYDINWDDSYRGTGNYSCDVKVSAFQKNQTTAYFSNIDSAYPTPKVITAVDNIVYMKVESYHTNSTGSFALRVRQQN